jgi:transposase
VGHHTEAFIGLDTGKLRNAVAVAQGGINGQVHFYGETDNTEAAMRKLIRKLAIVAAPSMVVLPSLNWL